MADGRHLGAQRRVVPAVALVALTLAVAACGRSGRTAANPPTAPVPASAKTSPAGPTYTVDQLQDALVKGNELSTLWKGRPGITPTNGWGQCAGEDWVTLPPEAKFTRVDLIDQRNDDAAGVFTGNTIAEVGLVFADGAEASTYLRSLQTAASACPSATKVAAHVRDGESVSGYSSTIGVEPLTIASWTGFMLSRDNVYDSRGYSDMRLVALGRGNAVIVLALGVLTAGRNATVPSGWKLVLHSYFDRIFYRVDGSPVPKPSLHS